MNLKTACGKRILVLGKTMDHLQAHPEAISLLDEAASMICLPTDKSDFFKKTLDFGRIIGETACVPVDLNPGTAQHFAFRKGRALPSHVVVDVPKVPSSNFTVMAFKGRLGDWILITGYVGDSTPMEPNDPKLIRGSNEFNKALEFWTNHALVYEPEIMGPVFESTWDQELKALM